MSDRSVHEEFAFSARDGLRLFVRHYQAPPSKARPVLCLAGVTRNGRDFHDLARALSQDREHPRRVYTLDSRGRGRSEFDSDWRNYTLPSEMLDVMDFFFVTGLHDLNVIGTSRGGLLAMLLATVQPGVMATVVLNDIGPVIERDGLARIAGYVGRSPLPHSWAEAGRMIRNMNARHFPTVSEATWDEVARALYNERNGKPAPGYDPKLSMTFSVLDAPLPPLWPQFEALKSIPAMAIRGENSDILSADTVTQMKKRHPALSTITVPGQGHAPLLKDAPTITAIARFLADNDPR